MKKLLRKWLGIDDTEAKLDSALLQIKILAENTRELDGVLTTQSVTFNSVLSGHDDRLSAIEAKKPAPKAVARKATKKGGVK